MTTIDIKKLNNTPIDWCYNCAKAACKTSKQKMFAWIVCFLMKSCTSNADYYYENIILHKKVKFAFVVNLTKVLNENEAIEDLLYKKNSWGFLNELIYNHISNSMTISKDMCKALIKPEILLENNRVFIVYDC